MRKLLILLLCLHAPELFAAPQDVNLVPLKRIATYGQNTATAGTEEVLASDTPVSSCCLKALAANTNNVYVGGNTSLTSSNGYVLDASQAICLDVDSPADIYIDVDTTGEGVSYICVR